ncbi:MAG: hypothetical protein M1820_008329 [Bogoriella megaspora]|nr:MAG: hypothetical protein M1820_008329 [Bogoriella megaspora]
MNGDSYATRDRHGPPNSHNHNRLSAGVPRSGAARGDRDERKDRDRDYGRERERDRVRDRDRDRDRDRGDRDSHRRRRSRSPAQGHRSSRREDVDSYSSSRNYREREREDRYRDRRGEREWDRDRADRSRRDARRDDDRPARRDPEPDLFDSRRGGDSRRDDVGGGPQARRRSATPPAKKKEPTPDLTDIVSVLERKRRMTQWDIKPPGYERITAEQAKLSGMFPLPGAPRQQPMDPSRLAALINQPEGQAKTTALKPSNARQSKRLFLTNLSSSATEESLRDFFNLQLNGLNVVRAQDPCMLAQVAKDRSFALLEFKNPEDATMALAFDGINMEDQDIPTDGTSTGGTPGLIISRPKDYIMPTETNDVEATDGAVSSSVPDTQNKLRVSGIPEYLTEEQVQEFLSAFGPLKSFLLVKDMSSGQSRGIAFCEFENPENTRGAIEGLMNFEIGNGFKLNIARASIGQQQVAGLEMGVSAVSMLATTQSDNAEQGRVIQLLNMVVIDELMNPEDYQDICEDVQEECEKYGKVLAMRVPRPVGGRYNAGVGKIFVKFEHPDDAQKALAAMAGRKFNDRTVVVTYFGEEYFDLEAW